jgi:hypothetical protein
MNIFEILAGDNSNTNTFFTTYSHSQLNWNNFKKIIK